MPDAPPRVLFVTSEIHPLVKTGGLGDVSASLPSALQRAGAAVRVLLPGYRSVLSKVEITGKLADFDTDFGEFPRCSLVESRTPALDFPLWVVDCPALYNHSAGPYQDTSGMDRADNYLRFGLLSRVAAWLGRQDSPIAWQPDIVHCNDWQSGLTPAYLQFDTVPSAPTVLTIHNLAFQGIFPPTVLPALGLPPASFQINGLEYYGNMSFLKAGLFYCDKITTVSPQYALEIQSAPLGMGMQGLLATRRSDLTGILNGIDLDDWDPNRDSLIAKRYGATRLGSKAVNKVALQRTFGLPEDGTVPLLGVVSRLTHQKGVDLILAAAPRLIAAPAQLIVLGSGDPANESALQLLAKANPDQVGVRIGFDEGLSHLITAGADIFLMPSRFEPCGLNQMYSQRYGTPPVVHRTGGLADSVTDERSADDPATEGTGFQFSPATVTEMTDATLRAIALWRKPKSWRALQRRAMARDFSWTGSAARYLELYGDLIATRDRENV